MSAVELEAQFASEEYAEYERQQWAPVKGDAMPLGKPNEQILEQFFNGTLPTPAEEETRAIKLADVQKAQNAAARSVMEAGQSK